MLEIKDLNMIDDSSKSETSENDPEDIPVGQEKSGADAGSAKCRFCKMQVLSSSLFSRCCSQLLRLFLISIAPRHISSNFLSSSFRLWMLYELSPSLSSSDNKLRAIV